MGGENVFAQDTIKKLAHKRQTNLNAWYSVRVKTSISSKIVKVEYLKRWFLILILVEK